jgi:hypothetical protein
MRWPIETASSCCICLSVVADRGARLAGDHELQPLPSAASARRRSDDFHRLAARPDACAAGTSFAVDARRHRVVADMGMHRVGEVERAGVARQRQDVALRREQIDLVREQVDLDVLEELDRGMPACAALSSSPGTHSRARICALLAGRLRSCTIQCAAMPRSATTGPCPRCGSALRSARRPGRTAPCAATGSRWPSGSRCKSLEAAVDRLVHPVHGAERHGSTAGWRRSRARRTHRCTSAKDLCSAGHLAVDAVRRLDAATPARRQAVVRAWRRSCAGSCSTTSRRLP